MLNNSSKLGTSIRRALDHVALTGRMARRAAAGAIALGLVCALAGSAAAATDGSAKQNARAGSAPRITLGACEMQSTLPFEESRRIECSAGQVIVAVYEDAVRCCTLEVR